VISVGNLHWGGTGKTPLTAAVAAYLRDQGHRVTVLSRGYGSRGKGVRVVSVGEGPLLGPGLAGDEPVLLAGMLPGVGVVVGPDRYKAGLHALERLEPPPEIFVLDDGFSHLGLQRDLDILALPASDPFGGGRLVPAGRLREPLASARRAHAAVLTGSESGEDQGERLATALRPFGFSGPGFVSSTRPEPACLVQGEPLEEGATVLLVSAIARPERFRSTVERAGFKVAEELRFSDHHPYPEKSLERIRLLFQETSARAVLTTSKDLVKLYGRLEIPLAELPIKAKPEPAFLEWLGTEARRLVDTP